MSKRKAKTNELKTLKKGSTAMQGKNKKGARALTVLTAALLVLACIASAAQAAAPQVALRSQFPDTASPGLGIRAGVFVENSGDAPMSGTLDVNVTLPEGVVLAETVEPILEPFGALGATPGTCEIVGQLASCEIKGEAMIPSAQEEMLIPLRLAEDASGELAFEIEVSGGGLADPIQRQVTVQIAPPEPFQIESFDALVHDAAGGDELQAGMSPYAAANNFEVPTFLNNDYSPRDPTSFPPFALPSTWVNAVSEHMRDIIVHAPAGVTANFAATPSRCTIAQLNTVFSGGIALPGCPISSQIGVAHVLGRSIVPVYSMVPPTGVAARFGFDVVNVPILIDAKLRPDDYGVDLISHNTSASVPIDQVDVELWGVPADESHDSSRGECIEHEEGNNGNPDTCSTDDPHKAFLRLPTSCSGPLHWGIDIDTYEHPGTYHSRETTTPAQVGCNQLEFTPTFEAKPSTNVADSPSGLELNLKLPQNEDPDGLAEANLKNLRMDLPQGLVLNSAGADGLGACSPAQIGLLSAVGQIPAKFNGNAPNCPASSKLGAVTVNTPAIDHPLPGFVYLATQNENPYGSLLSLYLVINDPQSGVIVKVPIKAELNKATGQITTWVQESPQLPFEDLSVELDKGSHAPLRTPINCGNFQSQSDWTPWTSPEGQDEHPTASFAISKGAGGGACVGSEAQAPFDPQLSAGTAEPKAGAFSPFTLKITRQDGSQPISGIDLDLPKGLLASLRGIPYCSDAVLNSIPTTPGTGRAEIANPSCPQASQIGTVSAQAGAGPSPLNVNTGRAYWTGPYKGAPVGMAVVFPAVAGPFDLGNVVVRTGFYVDPETAKITAKSDQIPTMLEGIPLDLRSVSVNLDRPDYTLNPTSCDPLAFQANIHSPSGQSAERTERFQVGGCQSLPFKPKLGLKLTGGTTRGKHPALSATLRFKGKGANVAKASVALPHSEFLDQSHIGTVCTRVQFAAHQCPAKSVYGKAVAYSPLLGYALSGPVYLRSSSHKLPDLVVDLDGQINVALVGRIDTDKNGGIRTTFESVPDAPVSKFTLRMQGGKKGLLQNSTNLCKGPHKATAIFEGQNGKSLEVRPELQAACGAKGRKATKK